MRRLKWIWLVVQKKSIWGTNAITVEGLHEMEGGGLVKGAMDYSCDRVETTHDWWVEWKGKVCVLPEKTYQYKSWKGPFTSHSYLKCIYNNTIIDFIYYMFLKVKYECE